MSRRNHQKFQSTDDFLEWLGDYTNELRDVIESECSAFKPGAAEQSKRKARALFDYEYFVNTYFPHYITDGTEPSEFHKFAFKSIETIIPSREGVQESWAAPRGEAKSTLVTNMLPIWTTIRDQYVNSAKNEYMLVAIIMDSTEQAQTMLAAIKSEFESNPRLRHDFGKVCGVGRVWNTNVILTANGIKMQAFGSSKRVRGLRHGPYRPTLVILDDIENDENVLNKEQRDKIHNLIKKSVLNLGSPDGSLKVFAINTILHYDSVSNRLQKDPTWHSKKFSAIMRWPDRMDLWDEWERLHLADGVEVSDSFYFANKANMDQGSVVSWPSMRPLLRLMKIRAGDHHAFDCEYQNQPSSAEFAPFSDLTYWVNPSRDWVFFGAHDQSLGKSNKRNDPSASLVGGYDRVHRILDVVEARIARIKPYAQIAQLIALQSEYNMLAIAIETVQFQEFFAQVALDMSAEQHMHLPIQPVIPHNDKELRIMSISPHAQNGKIRSHQRHSTLNEQLLHYPEADHDDGPDALEMLWGLARSNMRMLSGIKTGRVKAIERYDYGH